MARPTSGGSSTPASSLNNDVNPPKIKRPMNSFILYRSEMMKAGMKSSDAEAAWKSLSSDDPVKMSYIERAKNLAREHKEMYPDYVYKPMRKTKSGVSWKTEILGANNYSPTVRRAKIMARKEKRRQNKQREPVHVDELLEEQWLHEMGDCVSVSNDDYSPAKGSKSSTDKHAFFIKNQTRRLFEVVKKNGINVLQECGYLSKKHIFKAHYGTIYKRYDIPPDVNDVMYGTYEDRVLITDVNLDVLPERTPFEDIKYAGEFYRLQSDLHISQGLWSFK